MKNLSLIAFLATFSCAAQSVPAQEQAIPCTTTENAEAYLTDSYDEQATWTGFSINGLLIHLWTNEETGTWTLFTEDANGVSCLIARGEAFEVIPPQPQGELN